MYGTGVYAIYVNGFEFSTLNPREDKMFVRKVKLFTSKTPWFGDHQGQGPHTTLLFIAHEIKETWSEMMKEGKFLMHGKDGNYCVN